MTLIPGSDLNLTQKNFTWNIDSIDRDQYLIFKLAFDNPEVISMDSSDYLNVEFRLNDTFVSVVDIMANDYPEEYEL